MVMSDSVVKFIREKDLLLKRKLGNGACGETVLLYDEVIDEHFVCKKYAPLHDSYRSVLYKNFVSEIKLLHLIYHPNVVRVFNYYLYQEHYAGYILMEYIEGSDIETYLKDRPEDINEIFLQVIKGFTYLEDKGILHRDIRFNNIMVNHLGQVKIIDFGFGKKISVSEDYDKSITLNWWCELPMDFEDSKYSFSTEVYFVGKLFEKIILENHITHFSYREILKSMCQKNPSERISSFAELDRATESGVVDSITFSDVETFAYRDFSQNLYNCITKIEESSKLKTSVDDLELKLIELHKNVMLEEHLPSVVALARCFIQGNYYYKTTFEFDVYTLRNFIELLKGCSNEKKNIIIRNLNHKLENHKKYVKNGENDIDDDIPF